MPKWIDQNLPLPLFVEDEARGHPWTSHEDLYAFKSADDNDVHLRALLNDDSTALPVGSFRLLDDDAAAADDKFLFTRSPYYITTPEDTATSLAEFDLDEDADERFLRDYNLRHSPPLSEAQFEQLIDVLERLAFGLNGAVDCIATADLLTACAATGLRVSRAAAAATLAHYQQRRSALGQPLLQRYREPPAVSPGVARALQRTHERHAANGRPGFLRRFCTSDYLKRLPLAAPLARPLAPSPPVPPARANEPASLSLLTEPCPCIGKHCLFAGKSLGIREISCGDCGHWHHAGCLPLPWRAMSEAELASPSTVFVRCPGNCGGNGHPANKKRKAFWYDEEPASSSLNASDDDVWAAEDFNSALLSPSSPTFYSFPSDSTSLASTATRRRNVRAPPTSPPSSARQPSDEEQHLERCSPLATTPNESCLLPSGDNCKTTKTTICLPSDLLNDRNDDLLLLPPPPLDVDGADLLAESADFSFNANKHSHPQLQQQQQQQQQRQPQRQNQNQQALCAPFELPKCLDNSQHYPIDCDHAAPQRDIAPSNQSNQPRTRTHSSTSPAIAPPVQSSASRKSAFNDLQRRRASAVVAGKCARGHYTTSDDETDEQSRDYRSRALDEAVHDAAFSDEAGRLSSGDADDDDQDDDDDYVADSARSKKRRQRRQTNASPKKRKTNNGKARAVKRKPNAGYTPPPLNMPRQEKFSEQQWQLINMCLQYTGYKKKQTSLVLINAIAGSYPLFTEMKFADQPFWDGKQMRYDFVVPDHSKMLTLLAELLYPDEVRDQFPKAKRHAGWMVNKLMALPNENNKPRTNKYPHRYSPARWLAIRAQMIESGYDVQQFPLTPCVAAELTKQSSSSSSSSSL